MTAPLPRTPPALLAGLVLLATWALPAPTRADTAAMARFHYDEATRHYAERRYLEAIEQFFAAQRLSPNSRTLYNIGVCFLQLERPVQAHQFLTEYLESEDAVEGADERRAFARRSLEEMRSQIAQVTVTSDPPGARVYVDLEEHGSYGRTPRVLALPAGEHRIWVTLDGHVEDSRTITAVVGESIEVALAPEPVLGELRVEAALAADARVLDEAGAVVAEGPVPLQRALPPGRYDVEVRAEGYPPWRAIANVEANADARVRLDRESLPAPTGQLTITATAQRAEVRIDGQPTGFTPLALTGLRATGHRLSVRAEGLQPWEGEVELRADARAWLNVDLRPVPAERSIWTWIVGGVGLAAILAGGVTGAVALTRRDELAERSGPGVDTSGLAATVDDLDLAADLAWGAGALLVGISVVLFFATDRSGVEASSAGVSWGAP